MLEKYAKKTKNIFNVSWFSTVRYFELPAGYTVNIAEGHEELEFLYVEKGIFIEDSENEKVIMNAGDIVVYGSNYVHSNHCDGVHSASIFVTSFGCRSPIAKKFDGRNFFHADSELKTLISFAVNQGVKICDINGRYCPLHHDTSPQDIQIYKNIIECIILRLLGQLDDNLKHNEKVFIKSEKQLVGLAGEIARYLENNIYSNISINDVCQKFGYSKCHVCKVFKNSADSTIIDYYNELKIEEAKKLLLETNTSIEEISSILSFENPQYFSKVFRKYTNMTPSFFRHKIFKGSIRK